MDLKLCPHCMSPLSLDPMNDSWDCPRCGQDTSSSGHVKMDEEQYWETARKQCMYCGQPLLKGATTCPSCKSMQPE